MKTFLKRAESMRKLMQLLNSKYKSSSAGAHEGYKDLSLEFYAVLTAD